MYLIRAKLSLILVSIVHSHIVGDKAHLLYEYEHRIERALSRQQLSNCIDSDDCVRNMDIGTMNSMVLSPTQSPQTELKKLCEHAYSCFHDNVMICGKSVSEARTFLDLCDLYEYSCEYNMVFRHVKDEEGVCPNPKELHSNAG